MDTNNIPLAIQDKLHEIADKLKQEINADDRYLQNNLRKYLAVINISIILAAIFGVLCFIVATATGFNLFKQEKIAFSYSSLITVINLCLSIYNFVWLPRLIAQRRKVNKELLQLEKSDCINLN